MQDSSPTTFATRLKQLRQARGLSQPDLADAISAGKTTVSKWEAAETEPVLSGIRSLATFFGCTADYLIGLSDHPQALRPGDWLVDLVVLDAVLDGQQVARGEGLAVPIPSRFKIVDSAEYARISTRAREAANRPRKKPR